jgi:hypothetical protein
LERLAFEDEDEKGNSARRRIVIRHSGFVILPSAPSQNRRLSQDNTLRFTKSQAPAIHALFVDPPRDECTI